jgi:IS605 OrfB family transposase
MKRACKITLKFATARKRRAINALLESYRVAVNFYIKNLWDEPGIPPYQILEHSRLSARYKSTALKQAIEIVIATQRSARELGKPPSRPVFDGNATLDAKFVAVEEGEESFDLIIKLSVLNQGHRITIPTRKTAVLNKWLAQPGARIIQGCSLSEDSMILWVDIPDQAPKTEGRILGLDLGVNKLISDSDGHHYGTDFKCIRDRVRRRRPGSKGRLRAHRERDNLINRTVNQLPWPELRAVGIEKLKHLKTGKKPNRNKAFRKAMSPWVYRRVLNRIELKARENRVLPVAVDPANTSRQCPVCGTTDMLNRRGEDFLCVACGHANDADTVGARNILARTLPTLGSLESPSIQRVM